MARRPVERGVRASGCAACRVYIWCGEKRTYRKGRLEGILSAFARNSFFHFLSYFAFTMKSCAALIASALATIASATTTCPPKVQEALDKYVPIPKSLESILTLTKNIPLGHLEGRQTSQVPEGQSSPRWNAVGTKHGLEERQSKNSSEYRRH